MKKLIQPLTSIRRRCFQPTANSQQPTPAPQLYSIRDSRRKRLKPAGGCAPVRSACWPRASATPESCGWRRRIPPRQPSRFSHGKSLYRDVWFDKPPLSALVYLLWDARIGIMLRIAGAVFVFACCCMLWRFARDLWGPREGLAAALLLGFFLTFGIPAAVMALAPDLLMVLPHIAAVYLAWRGRPFLSGLVAGVALLLNAKAFFVLAACLFFAWSGAGWLLAGFVIPNIVALIWFGRPYVDQVWRWGAMYSGQTFSLATGFVRTWNWAGFQSALVLGAAFALCREKPRAMEDDRLAAAFARCSSGGLAILSTILLPAAARDGAARRPRLRVIGPLARRPAAAVVDPAGSFWAALCRCSPTTYCITGQVTGAISRSIKTASRASDRIAGHWDLAGLGLSAGYFRLYANARR